MPKLKTEQRESIPDLYRSGLSTVKIAAILGVCHNAVRQNLIVRGVARRTISEANSHPLLPVDESVFEKPTQEAAYWIGFLMADGCVQSNRPCIHLDLAIKDKSHVLKFKNFLKSEHKISYGHKGNSVYLVVCSKKLAADLKRHGVVPRKSLTAKVKLLQNNRDFWRGVVDGDGSFWYCHIRDYVDKAWKFKLIGSYPLMEQFATYVQKVTGFRYSAVADGSIYRITLVGGRAVKLLNVLYKNAKVSLDRKQIKAQAALKKYNG